MYRKRRSPYSRPRRSVIPYNMKNRVAPVVEVKYVDVNPVQLMFTATTGGTANWQLLNGLTQGSASYQRIGTKIAMKNLTVHYTIIPGLTNTVAVGAQIGRVLIVYDKQPTGVKPVESDVLKSYNVSGAASSTTYDQVNLDNRQRFLVLLDKFVYLPPLGVSGGTPANSQGVVQTPTTGSLPFTGKFTVKLSNLLTQYNKNSAGNIGDINSGSLYIFTMSNLDTNANAAWTYAMSARLRYID